MVVVSFFWGGWPLVARASGYGAPLGALILTIAGLVPIALAAMIDGTARPSTSELVKLTIAGVMMGVGLVAFNIVANSKMDASVSIPIIDAAMLVVSVSGAIYFFHEAITVQKLVGVVLLVTGILVLQPS